MSDFERARNPHRPILTEEFASQISRVTSSYPDEIEIRNLRLNPNHNRIYKQIREDPTTPLNRRHLFKDIIPPVGWLDFFNSLEHYQKAQLRSALRAVEEVGLTTVGSVRKASLDEMIVMANRQKWGRLGLLQAVFLKKCFPNLGS